MTQASHLRDSRLDGRAAWMRLAIALLISMIGSAPMWTVVVALPAVQAEFGTLRAGAALPYTMTMIGFMAGGVPMGRLFDRFGVSVAVPCWCSSFSFTPFYRATNIWRYD